MATIQVDLTAKTWAAAQLTDFLHRTSTASAAIRRVSADRHRIRVRDWPDPVAGLTSSPHGKMLESMDFHFTLGNSYMIFGDSHLSSHHLLHLFHCCFCPNRNFSSKRNSPKVSGHWGVWVAVPWTLQDRTSLQQEPLARTSQQLQGRWQQLPPGTEISLQKMIQTLSGRDPGFCQVPAYLLD